MILDANSLSEGATVRADVCIAGAGAAGMTLALALRDSGLSVVVLESGSRQVEKRNQDLYRGKLTGAGNWKLHQQRLRVLGGSTGHWTGLCKPLRPDDFAARPWIPNSGWPIVYGDLLPHYERAQQLLELGAFDYDARAWAEREGLGTIAPDSDTLVTEMYQISPPTRFNVTHAPALELSESTRVYLNANLVNIALASDDVSRFECATLEGRSFQVEAARFVLALGGIENARVLLASNRQRAEGVANGAGLVGRYFMEHPHYYNSVHVCSSKELELAFYRVHAGQPSGEPKSEEAPINVVGLLALSSRVRESERLTGFNMAIEPAADADWKLAPLAPERVRALMMSPDESGLYQLSLRAEQIPHARSRVSLEERVDALGMPRVRVHWYIDERANRNLYRAMEIAGAELGARRLGRLWSPVRGGRFQWYPKPGAHHMGTTRMSSSAKDGVVDANLKCHEVANLYVAGSSVFVTGADSNPTLTIVALADRLARHLMEAAA